MEGRDQVESLGGREVAAAQEKDQLIARRAQARGDVLEWRGKVEAAFAFDAIENRRDVEHLAPDAVEDLHARHGRLPVLILCTLRGEAPGGAQAEARAAASYNRYFDFKFSVHASFCFTCDIQHLVSLLSLV